MEKIERKEGMDDRCVLCRIYLAKAYCIRTVGFAWNGRMMRILQKKLGRSFEESCSVYRLLLWPIFVTFTMQGSMGGVVNTQ